MAKFKYWGTPQLLPNFFGAQTDSKWLEMTFLKASLSLPFSGSSLYSGLREGFKKQALRNSCELLRQRMELHASSCNCMQAH